MLSRLTGRFGLHQLRSFSLCYTVLTSIMGYLKCVILAFSYMAEVQTVLFSGVRLCAEIIASAFCQFRPRSGRKLRSNISGAGFSPFFVQKSFVVLRVGRGGGGPDKYRNFKKFENFEAKLLEI